MASINTYLTFDGNAEEAFNFYKSVFGGEFTVLQRFENMPQTENMSDADKAKIMHVSIPIGKDSILMASDTTGAKNHRHIAGNNFSLSVNADSEEEASKLFNGISAGGAVTMPMEKTFWGAYFGMCTDKFGIQWMVNYDYPKQ